MSKFIVLDAMMHLGQLILADSFLLGSLATCTGKKSTKLFEEVNVDYFIFL